MTAQETPLINRLILVVLALILVCLVILIAQNQKSRMAQKKAAVNVAQTEAVEEPVEIIERVPRASAPAPRVVRPSVSPARVEESQPQEDSADHVRTFPERETVQIAGFQDAQRAPSGASLSIAAIVHSSSRSPITGRVVLLGTSPAESAVKLDPHCSRLHSEPLMTKHYLTDNEGGLANVWVFIKDVKGRFPRPTEEVLLDQVGCEFQPYVFALRAGQPLRIRNSDPVLHNINTTASTVSGQRFNIAQPKQGAEAVWRFPIPELPLKFMCNVHPWMIAYAGVFDHPFFAVTDSRGMFQIPSGLPTGRYILVARHLKAGEILYALEIGEDKDAAPIEIALRVPSRPG